MTNHPSRKSDVASIAVQRLYNHNWQPSGIWHIDANRACTAEEIAAAAAGDLRMIEHRHIAGHPSYGTHKPGEGNFPSTGPDGGTYTLSPGNVREFVRP